MSWFNLKQPMGTSYRVDPTDVVNTKQALNQLGYYESPPISGINDWTDDAMFNGIRNFQNDNALKVDGYMRPGGPTEAAINASLAESDGGGDEGGNTEDSSQTAMQDNSGSVGDADRQRQVEFKQGQLEQQNEQLRRLKEAGASPGAIDQIQGGINAAKRELDHLQGKSRWPF